MKYGMRLGGLAAVATTALVALGACGNPIAGPSAHLPSEQVIGNAVGADLTQPGINLRVSLGGANQLRQAQHGNTPRVTSTLAKTSIVVNVYPGHGESIASSQFATDPNNQLDFAIQVGNTAPVEIRSLDLAGVLYVRADLTGLLSDFGAKGSSATNIGNELNNANSYVPGLAALGQGHWVSLNLKTLSPLLNQGGSNGSVSAQTKAAAAGLLSDLKSALTNNATYTYVGNQSGRPEYHLTVQAYNFVHQLSMSLGRDISGIANSTSVPGASNLSGQVTKALNQAAAQIPKNQTVAVQVWLSNNKLQEVDLDLNQFQHKYQSPVPLRLVIGPGTPVTTPSGVTPLDLSQVAGMLGGLMGGLHSSAS